MSKLIEWESEDGSSIPLTPSIIYDVLSSNIRVSPIAKAIAILTTLTLIVFLSMSWEIKKETLRQNDVYHRVSCLKVLGWDVMHFDKQKMTRSEFINDMLQDGTLKLPDGFHATRLYEVRSNKLVPESAVDIQNLPSQAMSVPSKPK